MSGPYNITQVDVPGALQVYMTAREARQQEQQRELQRRTAEAALQRQQGIQSLFRGYLGDGSAPSMNPPTTPPVTLPAPLPTASSAHAMPSAIPPSEQAGPPPVPAASPPAQAPLAGNRERLVTGLLALDPETGARTAQAFDTMDQVTARQTTTLNRVIAGAAQDLASVPLDQREARLDALTPDLIARGIRPEAIQRVRQLGLSDANLNYIINQSRDIEKIAAETRPDVMQFGRFLVDRNHPTVAIAQDPGVIRAVDPRTGEVTETVPVQGIPQLTGPAGGTTATSIVQGAPPVGTVRGGYEYIGGNHRDPSSWRPFHGGPASPPGGFPASADDGAAGNLYYWRGGR